MSNLVCVLADNDYCPDSDDHQHEWVFGAGVYRCNKCGVWGDAESSDLQDAYSDYVSTLDSPTVGYTTQYSTTYYYQIDTVEGPYTDYSYSLTDSNGTVYDWSFSSSPSFVLVSNPAITNPGNFNSSGSFSWKYHGYAAGDVLFWVTTKPFTPIADFTSTWYTMGGPFSSLVKTSSGGTPSAQSSTSRYCTVLHIISPSGRESLSWTAFVGGSVSHTFKAGYTYYFSYPVTFSLSWHASGTGTSTLSHTTKSLSPYPLCYSYDGDVSQVAEPSTRAAFLMQTINNYNTDNSYLDNSETVNYYIGTVDAGGDVTNIYNVNLYDEETLVFTEPVTGAQYQTTGWTYDYSTRCYTLGLTSGTFTLDGSDIGTIELTYGDDALTIDYYSGSSLVESDEYAYVRVAQSECALNGHTYTYETVQEPTCTTAGERKYTCSVCGNEYAEEIPKTDHSYTVSVEQEATCTTNGIELYTCSICGDQHTQTIPALGHDWLATEVTDTTYNLPPGAACPACGSTDFISDLDKNSGVYGCTCSECGAEWMESAELTYGHTEYTCSRCGETYIESNDPESGLFASIGNFIANGIGWVTDKLSDLIQSLSGINDIFSGFVESIKEKSGEFPSFLGAAIACLPEDLMTVIWFSVVAAVVLLVWKKWFH